MRKIIFSAASAAIAVMGFSSFAGARRTTTSFYWFFTANVKTLTASAITGFDRFAPTGTGGCSGAQNFCEVGYTIAQVHTSGAPLHQVTSVKVGQTLSFKAVELSIVL